MDEELNNRVIQADFIEFQHVEHFAHSPNKVKELRNQQVRCSSAFTVSSCFVIPSQQLRDHERDKLERSVSIAVPKPSSALRKSHSDELSSDENHEDDVLGDDAELGEDGSISSGRKDSLIEEEAIMPMEVRKYVFPALAFKASFRLHTFRRPAFAIGNNRSTTLSLFDERDSDKEDYSSTGLPSDPSLIEHAEAALEEEERRRMKEEAQ